MKDKTRRLHFEKNSEDVSSEKISLKKYAEFPEKMHFEVENLLVEKTSL